MRRVLLAAVALFPIVAFANPPPGIVPTPEEAKWYEGANSPDCLACCSRADGHPVQAKPDPDSPLGWDVLWDGNWIPVPAGTRATKCSEGRMRESHWEKPIAEGDYPPHPGGTAVIWEYPAGVIRCFSPPESAY